MSAQDDRLRAMNFEYPQYIPLSAGILAAAWMKYRDKLDALVRAHPNIFGAPPATRDYDELPRASFRQGRHVDAWGCVWANINTGMEAMVKGHPVKSRDDIRRLRPPTEDAGLPHGFMYLRLLDLRGFEEAMIDFAEEPPELKLLIDTVLQYNVRQMQILLDGKRGQQPQVLGFGDDLGMQHGLAIGEAKWRKYLKPCFARLYGMVRQAGHYVYMHTDGQCYQVIPDLAECGVNVINPQVRANGLDNLVRTCKGKVCVDLDLDRQLMPFATPAELGRHVREAVEALGSPEGGLWLKAELGPDVPLENIAAILEAMEKCRGYWRKS